MPSMLVWRPPLAEVTGTVTVQDPPAGITPPVKVTDEMPVSTVPPTQVVAAGPLMNTPAGNVSVIDAPLASVAPALLKVMVRVEYRPTR